MELTKKFSERDYMIALESWDWLDLAGKSPQFASLFGDLFLVDQGGAWWFLDTFDGQLIPAWASGAEHGRPDSPAAARLGAQDAPGAVTVDGDAGERG